VVCSSGHPPDGMYSQGLRFIVRDEVSELE
jgi:hypothetical protein